MPVERPVTGDALGLLWTIFKRKPTCHWLCLGIVHCTINKLIIGSTNSA
jgi:hypothetical protein